MKFEDIYKLMETFKTPCVKVSDLHGNIIIRLEDTKNVAQTVAQLRQFEPMISSLKKVEVSAGTEVQAKGNYKGGYKWYAEFESPGQNISGMNPQWSAQNNWMQQVPTGYVHTDVMGAKLEAIQKDIKHEREMRLLEEKYKNQNPIDQYAHYIPALMVLMGRPAEQIDKVVKYGMMGKTAGGIGFTQQPTNTLTFSDIDRMTPQEQNTEIQRLMDVLAEKVTAQHMILLLGALEKNPKLAETLVNMIPA